MISVSGKYLFKLEDRLRNGRISYPKGTSICGDIILISHLKDSVQNYKLSGELICWKRRDGNGEFEFNCPFGLAVDELNGDIYMCDQTNNNI